MRQRKRPPPAGRDLIHVTRKPQGNVLHKTRQVYYITFLLKMKGGHYYDQTYQQRNSSLCLI